MPFPSPPPVPFPPPVPLLPSLPVPLLPPLPLLSASSSGKDEEEEDLDASLFRRGCRNFSAAEASSPIRSVFPPSSCASALPWSSRDASATEALMTRRSAALADAFAPSLHPRVKAHSDRSTSTSTTAESLCRGGGGGPLLPPSGSESEEQAEGEEADESLCSTSRSSAPARAPRSRGQARARRAFVPRPLTTASLRSSRRSTCGRWFGGFGGGAGSGGG